MSPWPLPLALAALATQLGCLGPEPSLAECGNGVLRASEACDDANALAGDGCDAGCSTEVGWSCSGSPSVCAPICGDARLVGAEGCDDGNALAGDGCRTDCTVEACGDGIVDPGMLCFAPRVDYRGPPVAMPTDLDDDGPVDLVQWETGISVRRASSPGMFGPAIDIGPGTAAAAGRFNTDDFVDIAVIQGSDVAVYLNAGFGTFGNLQTIATVGESAKLAAGDLDGDGDSDIVASGCFGFGCGDPASTLVVLLCNGSGTFAPPVAYAGRVSNGTRAADLDGDGDLDVLTLDYKDDAVGFYESNGDGTFQDERQIAISGSCSANHLDVADVDHDGNVDVVVGSQCLPAPIFVLFGDGRGNFARAVELPVDRPTFTARFADLDNDGNVDVLAGAQNVDTRVALPLVYWFRGDGAGSFSPVVPPFAPGAGDPSVVTGDVDGDGSTDVLVSMTLAAGVSVYLSDP